MQAFMDTAVRRGRPMSSRASWASEEAGSCFSEDRDGGAVTVDAEQWAGLDDLGGGADVDDGGQAVLAGDDRAVGEDAAQVHDHAGGRQEVGGPRRIGDGGDEDFTRLDVLAVEPGEILVAP